MDDRPAPGYLRQVVQGPDHVGASGGLDPLQRARDVAQVGGRAGDQVRTDRIDVRHTFESPDAGGLGFVYLKSYGLNAAFRFEHWVLIDEVVVVDANASCD